jgi:hypothetical protein
MKKSPNKALQRTRSAPLRSALSLETLGRRIHCGDSGSGTS